MIKMFYNNILIKFLKFVKQYQKEIVLVLAVFLISLLSFFIGYINAKIEKKTPIEFIKIRK